MAKPGSDKARELTQMARQAHDLSDVKIPESVVEEMVKAEELKRAMRCAGCGRRIGVGFKFTRVEVDVHPQTREPISYAIQIGACNGDAPEGEDPCDFAGEARKGATAVELVEYVWLDAGERPVSIHEPSIADLERAAAREHPDHPDNQAAADTPEAEPAAAG